MKKPCGLTTDWWDGHVVKEVGIGYGRLLQSYGVHKTIREARSRGLRTHRRQEVSWSVLIRAPLARGDRVIDEARRALRVSIRAPLARGDSLRLPDERRIACFNPRPSCEGRPENFSEKISQSLFQSAPLLRGATLPSFPAKP